MDKTPVIMLRTMDTSLKCISENSESPERHGEIKHWIIILDCWELPFELTDAGGNCNTFLTSD